MKKTKHINSLECEQSTHCVSLANRVPNSRGNLRTINTCNVILVSV